MKNYLQKLYEKAVNFNHKNIFNLLEKNSGAKFFDLGCDDGVLTMKMANKIGTKSVYGVEIVGERIKLSEQNGVKVKKFDLNGKFDFPDNFFDVANANQVIEHLYNSDNFFSEIHRVLKPGGYAIISTENASSWCNIVASIMGWQIFSLTNFSSKKQGIGNPFALHRDDFPNLESWNHVRIYNIRGLNEYFEVFGFKVEKIKGSGYFPLSAELGNIDKTHCHFMTFKVRKI
ncbi:MAG TPA: methyltransferase domain-containing protein [Candidatus Paceibacterota bacterium]|nr:methyltransferase domain-containing protein [Candidatus Paceibacterota bacterium]